MEWRDKPQLYVLGLALAERYVGGLKHTVCAFASARRLRAFRRIPLASGVLGMPRGAHFIGELPASGVFGGSFAVQTGTPGTPNDFRFPCESSVHVTHPASNANSDRSPSAFFTVPPRRQAIALY